MFCSLDFSKILLIFDFFQSVSLSASELPFSKSRCNSQGFIAEG